jgi:6-phosphogluconolactonase (cycloisomerase 2 family)
MHGFQPREPSPKEQALMNTTARRTLRGGLLVAAAGTLIVPLGVHAAQANDPSPQRPGAVFSMTNNKLANSITTFQRRPDGTLEESGSVLTGGQGTGGPEDSANGLVLANVNGETSPTNTSGFTFDAEGQLTAIPGSTRPLSGLPNSGCTQVAFDKTGNVVIVDEQQADVITTYTRQADGTLSAPQPQQTTGNGPFGLTFTQRNQLLTTENFGAAPGQGALSSYAIDERSGALTPLSPSVRNGQSDTCWVAITDDNRFAFTSSFGDDGGISSYRVRPDGSLELLNSQAATVGAGSSDVALSGNSRYLYVKNSVQGTVTAFRIENDGALTRLDVDADGQGFGSIGLAAQ